MAGRPVMGECSERVCYLCAGEEAFQVEVGASEEAVRLGQALNITCLVPLGPAFQQQWLHPKKQASELGRSLSDTAHIPPAEWNRPPQKWSSTLVPRDPCPACLRCFPAPTHLI